MTTSVTRTHVCIDCVKDPPRTIRPIATDPGQAARCASHKRAFRDHRRRVSWAARIRREFGIEPEDYWALYDEQGGTCAMARCPANGKTKMLAVDHDHAKAAAECSHDPARACRNCIRGLMCGPHNYELIGKFKNSLQDALDYLADPPAHDVFGSYL